MRLKTVNVIAYSDDTISGMRSWSEDKSGNRAAEAEFKKMVKLYAGSTPEDISEWIDGGYWESDDGYYKVFLVHSD